jgi:signal transduction histidine kinase
MRTPADKNALAGAVISEHRAHQNRPGRPERELRALAAYGQSVREEERARIAREIHDELGQALTGLQIQLSWLEKSLPGSLAAPAATIRSMSRLIDDTIDSVRRIASDLRPQVLDELGLADALRRQARAFQARAGIRCRMDLPAEPFAMDPERASAVFRIFQEAMTNVARHAKATRVDVRLRLDAGQLLLSVADNGRGMSPAAMRRPNALGLLGVRERASLLGATIEIGASQSGGARVRLSVPLHPPARPCPLRE